MSKVIISDQRADLNDLAVVGVVPWKAVNGVRVNMRDAHGHLVTLEMEQSQASIVRDLLTKHLK